jgi:polysaccharide export outer membrane protein
MMNKFLSALLLLFVAAVPAFAVEADDYVIGDGDFLKVSVWGVSELSTDVKVRPDGKITLPGIGDAIATGFTPAVLSEKLAGKLQEFVKKPIVTVTVTGITNNKIYVFGGGLASGAAAGSTEQSILSAGVYNLPGRTTLLKFLSTLGNMAGADMDRAYIIRDGKKIDVNFYDLFIKADISKDVMLKAEDMLYIPDNQHNRIYVMGAVNSPKYIFYRRDVRILDAILEAGGFTKYARENSVLILRKESGQTKEITVRLKDLMKDGDLSQNITLMPGDFVIVREGIF